MAVVSQRFDADSIARMASIVGQCRTTQFGHRRLFLVGSGKSHDRANSFTNTLKSCGIDAQAALVNNWGHGALAEVNSRDTVIWISESGELGNTAELDKEIINELLARGVHLYAMTSTPDSTVARQSQGVIYVPEGQNTSPFDSGGPHNSMVHYQAVFNRMLEALAEMHPELKDRIFHPGGTLGTSSAFNIPRTPMTPLIDTTGSKIVTVGRDDTVTHVHFCNDLAAQFIAGPCVVESEAQVMRVAEEVVRAYEQAGVTIKNRYGNYIPDNFIPGLVFKASYRKSNRRGASSFTGVAIDTALEIFDKVRQEFRIPVMTDVRMHEHVDRLASVVDMLQLPEASCDLSGDDPLIYTLAQCGLPIHIKKGKAWFPAQMKNVVEKFEQLGQTQLILCDRGFEVMGHQFQDSRDAWKLKELGYPATGDITHVNQFPGALGTSSGGDSCYTPLTMRTAIAQMPSGLFMETHYDPTIALSDGPCMVRTDLLQALMTEAILLDVRHKSRESYVLMENFGLLPSGSGAARYGIAA